MLITIACNIHVLQQVIGVFNDLGIEYIFCFQDNPRRKLLDVVATHLWCKLLTMVEFEDLQGQVKLRIL
jgi:hypothetical protein